MSGNRESTLYDVLGLGPGASAQDVRTAWRRLAQQHHPDRGDAADNEAMARINQAYEVLSDPDRRARYDHGRSRPSQPRMPGRVALPGDRARIRWALAAGGTLAAATAAWALVHGLADRDAAQQPGRAGPPAHAPLSAPPAPARPTPVRDGRGDPDAPLHLIPSGRLETHLPATRRDGAPTAQRTASGARVP